MSTIIYLDSPCGVGLSYSDNSKNYVTGDLQTASDTHAFLLKVMRFGLINARKIRLQEKKMEGINL